MRESKFTVIILLDNSEKSKKIYESHIGDIQYIYCGGKNILPAMNEALGMAQGKYVYFTGTGSSVSKNFFNTIDRIFRLYPEDIAYAAMPVNCIHGYRETRIRFKQGTEASCLLYVDTAYGVGFTDLSSVIIRTDCAPRFAENLGIWEAKQTFLNDLVNRQKRFIWLNEVSGNIDVNKVKTVLEKNYADIQQFVIAYFGTYWKKQIERMSGEQNEIPYYAQYSFVNELVEFLSLFGQDQQEDACISKKFWDAMHPVLQMLDDALLIDALGMHDMSRIIFFMNKKYNCSPGFLQVGNDFEIQYGSTTVGMASYQSVVLHFIDIENSTLRIEGETSVPSCFLPEEIQTGVEVNGVNYSVHMEKRKNHKYLLGEIYEYADTFIYICKLEIDTDLKIRFYTIINGVKVIYHAITCMRFAAVSGEMAGAYAVQNGYLLAVREDTLICKKVDTVQHKELEISYQKSLQQIGTKDAKRAACFRKYYFYFREKKHRPIWLFFDRIDKADDNGEALFRYACDHKSETIDIYFVIDKKCKDYKRLKSYGKVVAANTAKHQMLLVLADYIFTSQLNGFVENPFLQNERYYRDIQHHAKVIFLQHGITKDNHTRWLNRFNQNLEGLITSAHKETEAFLKYPYHYEKAQIWETGMPRYDYLYHAEKKRILVMPTWRESLMEQVWNPVLKVWQWRAGKEFGDSMYCRNYSALLTNRRFLECCREYGYQVIFLPHPLVQPYRDSFQVDESVNILSMDTTWRDAFAECDLMITDYSSVAFDFAYLRKPVIYYQFDRDDFFAHHTYQKGYFDYFEDGFGEVVSTESELLEILERYIKSDCQLKGKYKRRINQFFCYEDKNSCERIMERI